MKIYLKENVYEAALNRIRRLYDEFPEVIVNFSGGKDSTVVLNLTLKVAEERGRLPVNVLWLDQEAEWENVVSYVRGVMNDPRVRPLWFQGPFRLFNATSTDQPWLHCWRDGDNWIRPKEPNSIHENITGVDRFAQLFEAFSRTYFGDKLRVHIAGVRCDESPARLRGLTTYPTYKDMTWGSAAGKRWNQYTMYPIYDWSYIDVWKAIHDNGWPYCKLYDLMYQYGLPVNKMRVSNVHHETAVSSLGILQEIEPRTWNAVLDRVQGVNSAKMHMESYRVPHELPFMFASWTEYRDHLLANLVPEDKRAAMQHRFGLWERMFDPSIHHNVIQAQIASILVNDYEGVKQTTFVAANGRFIKGRGKHKRWTSTPTTNAE